MVNRTTVSDCRQYVEAKKPFQTSNKQLYGNWLRTNGSLLYVVYSYGPHWPLFIWDETTATWYHNTDKYSVTTSKHYSKACPRDLARVCRMDAEKMRMLERQGYAWLAEQRVVTGMEVRANG